MSKSMANFAKGVVAGVVVGTTVGIVIHGISKPSHNKCHKKRSKGAMIRNIGSVVGHITDMMR